MECSIPCIFDPLNRVDFWNDSSNTTNSASIKYISMKNIKVLTNYMEEVENTYSAGEKNQATVIARAYYTAEFNDRIDAFIIR